MRFACQQYGLLVGLIGEIEPPLMVITCGEADPSGRVSRSLFYCIAKIVLRYAEIAAVEVLDCQTQRLIGGVILNAGIILNRWRGTQRRVGHVGVWIGGKAPAQREA